jgi:hypothetical protein
VCSLAGTRDHIGSPPDDQYPVNACIEKLVEPLSGIRTSARVETRHADEDPGGSGGRLDAQDGVEI